MELGISAGSLAVYIMLKINCKHGINFENGMTFRYGMKHFS